MDTVDWFYSVMTGVLVICHQICRFMALKNEKAAKLQKLNFLSTLFSFMFDLLLFHQTFSTLQYVGMAAIFSLYVIQIVMYKVQVSKLTLQKEVRKAS